MNLFMPVVLLITSGALQLKAQTPPPVQDLGPTNGTKIVTSSLVLNVRNLGALESYVASTQDPNSRSYHRFLSLPEFVLNYAPDSAQISAVTQYLKSFGIKVTEVYADNLLIKASGTVAAFNKAFAFSIHDFSRAGKQFHRPDRRAVIPASLKDALLAVVGPSDEPRFSPRNVRLNDSARKLVLPPEGAIATGVPEQYTVGDVANFYDINPLYNAGINGAGQTIGIATLAKFFPSDAYHYWKLVGLQVDRNRIKVVNVDGGGELSAAAGSGETSLDVEQSGGLAPAANIIVYDAPNTNAAFIDLFYKAASDNLVDSLSTSWGQSEVYYFAALNNGVDETGQLGAFHQAFLELAAQGISTFASAGDSGAYDANSGFNQSFINIPLNNVLSVDSPGSDPAITAAGGTTLPITLTPSEIVSGVTNPPNVPPLVVSTQQVWGWDYLQNYMVQYVGPKYQNFFFPVGGGGGVSIFWLLPAYQRETSGIRQSQPGQLVSQGQVLLNLPAFPGRNLPDVALNADPYSGYILVSTKDGGILAGYGGTSFVAPQLNGISALLSQAAGQKRIGLWNPMLYRLQRFYGYSNASPFVNITSGDNWYYLGLPGYGPAAGIGVLDVTKLARAVIVDGLGSFQY